MEEDENEEEEIEVSKENKKNSVSFEDKTDEVETEEEKRMVTRSMTELERKELERKELEKEQIATFWLQIENTECFDDVSIDTVEEPVREHKTPEVVEAKQKELENLEKYEVFEEVKYEGQETVGSRWVITKKEKAD